MSDLPNLEETIERLEALSVAEHVVDIPSRRLRELASNALALLQAQGREIENLKSFIKGERRDDA